MASIAPGAPALEGRFRRLPPGKHGLRRETVAANQRQRVFDAIVLLVARDGYSNMTLRQVASTSRVSRRYLPQLFRVVSKEQCFLWALDQIVRHAIANTNRAYRAEEDWQAKLTSGFGVFMGEVLDRPDAARVALVEAFSAGPAAVRRMEAAAQEFERMLRSTYAASPERVQLHALTAKGIVGGISRVVRQRLLDGELDKLRTETDALVEWTLAYHSNAAAGLAARRIADPTPRGASRLAVSIANGDERCRLLAAAARFASHHGYSRLTVEVVAREAQVTGETFRRLFPGGTEECFLEAYHRLGADVAHVAARTGRSVQGEWPQRVLASLHSILWRIARDPVFARLAFVEVFSAGPAGISQRSWLIQSFSTLLRSEAGPETPLPEVTSEAIVGAIWQIAHQTVTRNATHRLPELGDLAGYLVLAPLLGGERAVQEIRAHA
jgi:TetR/AcrR family transcriptional regulator